MTPNIGIWEDTLTNGFVIVCIPFQSSLFERVKDKKYCIVLVLSINCINCCFFNISWSLLAVQ